MMFINSNIAFFTSKETISIPCLLFLQNLLPTSEIFFSVNNISCTSFLRKLQPLADTQSGVFLRKIAKGGGGGAYMCQCMCMLETPEKLPHDIVESVVDICNKKPGRIAI